MSLFSDITDDIATLLRTQRSVHARYKTTLVKKLHAMKIHTAGDILMHVPSSYEDRTELTSLAHSMRKEKVLIHAQVASHAFVTLRRRGRLLKIILRDDSGQVELHCYGREFLQRVLSVGSTAIIWGHFIHSYGAVISSDFEVITDSSRRNTIVPRYALYNTGISQNMFSLCVKMVLECVRIPNVYEGVHDTATITRYDATRMMHVPLSEKEVDIARKYFAFDELLLFQLSMQYERKKTSYVNTIDTEEAQKNDRGMQSSLVRAFVKSLPFELTEGQIQSINEISYDMHQSALHDSTMRRILQGDVGSGKTIVALCVALFSIESGYQACFAVPSEALALQHFSTIEKLCEPFGIRTVLITGSMSSSARKKAYAEIAEGSAQCIVGTHALYSDALQYKNLHFVVIDEQHRFGIAQRAKLLAKGENTHALFMSATPIPRTLALTLYSNLPISSLRHMPKGRTTVRTRLVLYENSASIYAHIKEKLAKGEQAFFVFPVIDDIEKEDEDIKMKNSASMPQGALFQNSATNAISARMMYPIIQKALLPYSVALLHSKVSPKERERIVQDFSRGDISALVSTTIIEVGIDVPKATTMCIFDSQRFGLATLHQLRGRVGRSTLPSEAIFVYKNPLSQIAKERLKVLYEETDGFIIAERDLLLRGPGDIHQLGIRQSGLALFDFFDMKEHQDIIAAAHASAQQILSSDPHLRSEKHALLRTHILSRTNALV